MKETFIAITLIVLTGLNGFSTKKIENANNLHPAADSVRIINPGFEKNFEESWKVSNIMGAAGSGIITDDVKRSGNHSLKLSKTNSVGYVQLSSKKTIRVNPGETYTLRFRFNSSNAQVTSFLIPRLVTDNSTTAVSNPYSALWVNYDYDSQSLMRNSPTTRPEDWIKRIVYYENKTEKPQEIYIQVMLYGNPFDVYVDDFEFVKGILKGVNNPPNPGYNYTVEQVNEILTNRKEESSYFSAKDGVTRFYSNGKEEWPVFYRATTGRGTDEENTKQDPAGFAVQGVKINAVFTRIFDYWQNQDSSVWKETENDLLNILRKNPNARILLDLRVNPNQTWLKQYPDETWQTKDGRKLNEAGYSSEHWRTAGAEAIQKLIQNLKKNGYWKIVVGINFMGGHDGQFWTKVIGEYAADYSQGNVRAWQTYLKDNYKDIKTLNSVWNSTYQVFSEIQIPDPTSEHETLPAIMPKGPVTDFRQFCEFIAFDLRDCLARAVWKEAGKDFFVSAYGMPMENQHEYFLKTAGKTGKANNVIASMSYYPYRQPGLASGYHPEQSFGFHNSGFLQELDLRYYTCDFGGSDDELALMWVGSQHNITDWRNMHRKLTGVSLAQNQGYWYYDMQKQFNNKDVQNEIGAVKKIADKIANTKGVPFRPDVCLVRFGAESRYYGSSVDNAVGATVQWQYMLLETSGVPYDVHYLSDIMSEPSLQQYNIYIFHNNTFLSDKEREWITTNLKKNKRTIVWTYDTGYATEKGLSSQALSDLTGMSVKTKTGYTRSVAIVTGKDKLVGGEKGYLKIPEFQGMAEALCGIFTTSGPASIKKPFKTSWGYMAVPGVSRYQKIWIDGGYDASLAKYREDGKTAMAIKRFPDWTSIYIAAPNALAGEMMNNIAREAGAYRSGPAALGELRMSGRFVSYHALKSGKYEFQLPKGATKVMDANTGKILAEGAESYTIEGEAQTTYWFVIE